MLNWIDNFSWPLIIIGCLTLGLAPFYPQPHLIEKWGLLVQNQLSRPIDIFDLCLHSSPYVLLILKGIRQSRSTQSQ